jgi:hypothetical protein
MSLRIELVDLRRDSKKVAEAKKMLMKKLYWLLEGD